MFEANILKHFEVLLDLFLSLVALVPLYCGMPALSGDTRPEVQFNSPLLEEEGILKLEGELCDGISCEKVVLDFLELAHWVPLLVTCLAFLPS